MRVEHHLPVSVDTPAGGLRVGSPGFRPLVSGTTNRHGQTVCAENEFRCEDGHCIRLEWKCDGSGDCANGEDEKDCRECAAQLHRVPLYGSHYPLGRDECSPLP